MNSKKNIVLIGFMGVGKTSIGKLITKKLNYKFIDTDEQIEKQTGLTINEIFNIYGEDYFRKLEQQLVEQVSKHCNTVISTGGGVVLSQINVQNLKKNGKIILIEASKEKIFNNIKNSSKRPLLGKITIDKIQRLLTKRRVYYLCYDYKINVDNLTIEQAADEIKTLIEERNK